MHLLDLRLERGRRRKPAEPPTRHGPRLGERVHHDGLVPQLRATEGKTLVALLVAEAVVDVVADHHKTALGRHAGHGVQGLRVKDAAGGVVGARDDDGAGPESHHASQVPLANLKAGAGGVQGRHAPVSGTDDGLVETEGRRGHHNLVTGI